MRYALISDIHANRHAFEAALNDIDRANVDMVLCLGDIVGYGPCPVEVMDIAYEHIDVSVLGNHDAVVCNKFSSAYFNPQAKRIIEWTRDSMRESDVDYFNAQAYLIDGDHFKCAHSNFVQPDSFGYVMSPEDAYNNFQAVDDDLLFVGHTHVAGAHVLSKGNHVEWLAADNTSSMIKLQKNKRYLINVGSIGVSRTEVFKANFCIYDSEAKTVEFRVIDFDIDAFLDDIRELDKPEVTNYFSHLL